MTYRIRNIGIAIALAVVAALLTSFYVTNYKRNVQKGEKSVTVYVASRTIPVGIAGHDVASGHWLSTKDVPRKSVVQGAISSPDQIDSLVSTERTYAGEQVTTNRFRPVSERGVRAELKGTVRALQVAGDPNQLLAGTLRAGDHVDVVASLKLSDNSNVHATRIVLRDIPVLRPPSAPSQSTKLVGASESFSALLAVTDTQVQKLFFVMKNSDWSLELRPPLKAADSPESLEWVGSLLTDGLHRNQFFSKGNLRKLVLQQGSTP